MGESNGKHWTENYRALTPILVTITIFIMSAVFTKVNDIDVKLFKHLTNDEIHTVKGSVVGKGEFELYQKFRQDQIDSIKYTIESGMKELRDGQKQLSVAITSLESEIYTRSKGKN